jgi:RNA polymerase sigma-70 factor (ECF subfamily)
VTQNASLDKDPRAANILTLLGRARSGDEAATGALLESYEKYLKLLARVQIGRQLQGKVDASDIVQEAFLEAHRQIKIFRGNSEAELLGWLRAILAGQMAQMLRRYLKTKGRDVNMERELIHQFEESSQAMRVDFAASGSTPSQTASKREQAVLLAEALSQLSDDHRETIILRHLEHLSFKEVAARMGRSEDSVQKLWVRALGNLRQILGGTL